MIMLMMSIAYASSVCQIFQGDVGKVRYEGKDLKQAMERTVHACLDKRVQLHIKHKGIAPDDDRMVLYIETCANEVKCIDGDR